MIELILIVTAILSIRLKPESMLAVLCFSGFCLLYGFVEIYIENNYMYYLAASVTDLVIIYYLSTISKPTEIIVNIQTVCKWFVYANLSGFIIYLLDLPDIMYSTLCGSLYIVVLLSVIFQGGSNGVHRNSNLPTGIHPYYIQSEIVLRQNKKATRT